MIPSIVQMLAVLAERDQVFKTVWNRSSGFMHSRVHFGQLSRDAVFGTCTFQLPPMDGVPTEKIINEVRDSLWCQKLNSGDRDFHADVLIKLLDDAVLASGKARPS